MKYIKGSRQTYVSVFIYMDYT